MIEFIKDGDLLGEQVDALVNTVNCVGVMGRGVALQFKNKFPENNKQYVSACKKGLVRPGKMFVTSNGLLGPQWIVNFPTKRHWRHPSRMVDIELGLNDLVSQIERLGIRSVALPPLGCGLGGLDWRVVREVIERKLASLPDVRFRVYEPNDAQVHVTVEQRTPTMTIGRAVLLSLSDRYVKESMIDFDFTLLALHKLLYFVQAAGFELKLKYEKAPAGPFAVNLGNVLKHIEGHFVLGYNDGGDSPLKVLRLVDDAVAKANAFLVNGNVDVEDYIDKVLALVGPNGDAAWLELLSSVHWLCQEDRLVTSNDAFAKLWEWNDRKRRFTHRQVDFAFERLKQQGWIG